MDNNELTYSDLELLEILVDVNKERLNSCHFTDEHIQGLLERINESKKARAEKLRR
jgi:non-homologous end joining protein Ku